MSNTKNVNSQVYPEGSAKKMFNEFWKYAKNEKCNRQTLASLAYDSGHDLRHKDEYDLTMKQVLKDTEHLLFVVMVDAFIDDCQSVYKAGSDEEKRIKKNFLKIKEKIKQCKAGLEIDQLRMTAMNPDNSKISNVWISVDDRPLYTIDENGNWTCTEDGCNEFIAAVPYGDTRRPNETNLWWIRHCVVEDCRGLCVVGDDDNEPAGWQLEQVVYWIPWVTPPSF